jgi:hypothetical protein
MPHSLPQERWIATATERFARIDAWRQTHPTATWAEIEAAIDAQLGPLRAELLRDTAVASAAADLRGERPRCAECGRALVAGGRHRRRLRGEHNVALDVERTYARCPACRTGLFPPG